MARNRAFVFVKPHALTDAVKDFVRDHLRSKNIIIEQEGCIDAAAIDKDMLVDKHYYAIASKATLLKPDKLLVPEDKFEAKFGVPWQEVLRNGRALNARDACECYGVDAAGLGELWNQAKAADQLIKFSGGFYCAKIDSGRGPFYVFNGFFMEMRNKYVVPGAAIHYFLVEWSPTDLAWVNFRAKVLGPTDPSKAPADSIRGTIYTSWEEFGLPEMPTIQDNGVHASASPIEALFERMNWLGLSLEDDPYGAALLKGDIAAELLESWRRDPQVSFGRGPSKTKSSLYDALEDLDTDRCTLKCKEIAHTGRTHTTVSKNRAFVFIKPHAVTKETKDLVRQFFEERRLRITQEGVVEAEQIDQDMLIDRHYYAIASKATLLTPDKLPVPAAKFKAAFGEDWPDVLAAGRAFNAKDACDRFHLSAAQLGRVWNEAKEGGRFVKFAGGFYCARFILDDDAGFYVFNGFFMEMRNKFVKPGAEIHYFLVEWDPVKLSWKDFRGELLGPTDPKSAPEGSLRGMIFRRWQELGLASTPSIADNGVHASASPVEAMFERVNWLGTRLERDPFGRQLLEAGVSRDVIEEWSKDPQVQYGFGNNRGSFYDCLEDKDTDACLGECLSLARAGHTPTVLRNSAFVFVKPDANTAAAVELVRSTLAAKGMDVVDEGIVDATRIKQGMLFEKHYQALSSAGSVQEVQELAVPEGAFQEAFGIEWQRAVQEGHVANAQTACERLNVSPARLSELWHLAEKEGQCIKLTGKIHCARIDATSDIDGRVSVFVINGFIAEMREKFVAPGAAIHYFLTEWDPLELSWKDFRAQVLGPTNPSIAPEDSLRGTIFARWQELGLQSEPSVQDNCVHGSASPFEALSERMIWLGIKAEDDSFGQLLLQGGVQVSDIEAWCRDPQVTYESQGRTVTDDLYSSLEDLDADRCVTQCQIIVGDKSPASSSLIGEEAEQLHAKGKIINKNIVDTYDKYSMVFYVEDPDSPGALWEVACDMFKNSRGHYDEKAVWSGRRLTDAEVQRVWASVNSSTKRSPLKNRLPS